MARKHLVENPPQPTASEDEDVYSSEEDEETSPQEVTAVNLGNDHEPKHEEPEDDEDDESDDEEEAEDDGKDKTPVKAPAAAHQDNSDSESESGSDSGCTPPPSPSQFRVKPIVSKPAESKPKKAEKKQKIKSLDKVQPTSPPVTSAVEDPNKSSGSAKLWNEEDEITVFKGMITFKAEKGVDPFTDLAAFYDYVKGSLLVSVSKSQLSDKAKRLRKKYKDNVERGRNGEDPVFTKPHEQTSFDLSKKIWGSKANTENSNTTSDNVNATTDSANVNSNAKVGNKRKAKTSSVSVSVNGGGNEVASVATVLALPIKESNAGSSVGVSGKKQKTVTKKEKEMEKEVANGEGNEHLKMKVKKEEEVVEDQTLVSFNHSTNLFPLKDGKLEDMLLDNVTKPGNDKANELKKKWSEFQMDQLKLYIRRTELLNETAMFVLGDRKP